MLPFNDVRHVEYYNGRELDQSRLYRRWSLKNELKLLLFQRQCAERSTATGYSTELEPATLAR